MEGTYSTVIERSREDVFAWMDDPDNLQKSVPMLVDHGVIEETPEKVGTTFWHEYEENGRRMKMTGVVTEHKPPERMAVELDGAMFSLRVAYDFEELGPTTTRLTQHSSSTFKHVFKIFGLIFGKKMKADGEKLQAENFARMKALMEGASDDDA